VPVGTRYLSRRAVRKHEPSQRVGEEESEDMHKMTERFLSDAYAGESQAFMKYNIWADKAEAEGKKNVARMFRAIAAAEKVHATNHWRTLGMVQDTAKNLDHAIEGENFEVDEMYPAYKAVAEHQGEKGAVRSTHWALETEKAHVKMYDRAKKAVEAGKDVDMGDVYICPVCGFTMEGTLPDLCPVCNAKKESFRKY